MHGAIFESNMIIGILQVDLFISDCRSLKEKRMLLKSLKTRLRNNFNVAVSELDHHEKWQRASIGAASIGNQKKPIDAMLARVVQFIEHEKGIEIIEYSTELL